MKPLGIGGKNVREIAALLRSKGRGRDTILAHINPEEAALLKARGGSGKINPHTGVMEFDDGSAAGTTYNFDTGTATNVGAAPTDTSGYGGGLTAAQGAGTAQVPSEVSSMPGAVTTGGGISDVAAQGVPYTGAAPYSVSAQQAPAAVPSAPVGGGLGGALGTQITNLPTGGQVPTDVWNTLAPAQQQQILQSTGGDQGALKSVTDYLNQNPWVTRLGGAALSAIPGIIQANKAKQQAQQLQQQYATLGQPYQQTGQAMAAAGERGELTAANQQAYEAAKAQALQGVANRGMVGGAATANQLAGIYSNLANQQITQGLQIAGIGDQYVAQGITAGLQANTQLNNSLMQLYSQVGSIVAGSAAYTQPKAAVPV
jgi:hypothetical protein